MNTFKLTFTFKKKQSKVNDQAIDTIWSYLSCLYRNGQILRNYELIAFDKGFWTFLTLPDDDALSNQYNNVYVDQYQAKLTQSFNLSQEKLGKNLDQPPSCSCNSPSWYMLNTSYCSISSPVVCGDCGQSVALYKLPHIYEQEELFAIVQWQETYKNIVSLWISGLSDRFTLRQMRDPASRLSRVGRDICHTFEEKTGKPFYYFLFNSQRVSKTCPICGEEWRCDKETIVDHKCHSCRVVASGS